METHEGFYEKDTQRCLLRLFSEEKPIEWKPVYPFKKGLDLCFGLFSEEKPIEWKHRGEHFPATDCNQSSLLRRETN